MRLYKKMKRIAGTYYLGQGYAPEIVVFTDWYEEDDPALIDKEQEIRKEYEYWNIRMEEVFIPIEREE